MKRKELVEKAEYAERLLAEASRIYRRRRTHNARANLLEAQARRDAAWSAVAGKRRANPRKKKGDPDRLHLLAVKYFGTTENPYEAGFVMSDGEMLDLSGKNDGGSAGLRQRDHREVSSLVFEAGYPRRKEDDGTATPAMFLFMRETGAIRFSRHRYGPHDREGNGGDAMIQVEKKPTVAQVQAVARACVGCTYVRISHGQDREMVEIEPATPGRVRMVLESIE